MPHGGSGWQWYHVIIDGKDLRVTATCNGAFASAQYARQSDVDLGYPESDPRYNYPYVYPDGQVNVSDYTGACDEATLKQWAITAYPNRVGGI